ncbi:MAG: hypothetical protein NWE89_13535 [Candidatus Bathyarchaeota archaeon]|nr:hypothetical protein [Candidatus Bathyarchaeota archaeon]
MGPVKLVMVPFTGKVLSHQPDPQPPEQQPTTYIHLEHTTCGYYSRQTSTATATATTYLVAWLYLWVTSIGILLVPAWCGCGCGVVWCGGWYLLV